MASRKKQIEEYENTFLKRLEDFVAGCNGNAEPIGDLAQWRIERLLEGRRNKGPRTEFRHIISGETRRLPMEPFPEGMTHEEIVALRDLANAQCERVGFEPLALRTYSFSDLIKGARKGDSQAWQDYIRANHSSFTDYASQWLSKRPHRFIVDPAEIVDDSLAEVDQEIRRGMIKPDENLRAVIAHHIRENARGLPVTLRRQSRGGNDIDFDSASDDSYHNALTWQVPDVLALARDKMRSNPRQQQALDVIIRYRQVQEEAGAGGRKAHIGLELTELAEHLGGTRENARVLMRRVTSKIQEAALELGYPEAMKAIDSLIYGSSQGPIRRI